MLVARHCDMRRKTGCVGISRVVLEALDMGVLGRAKSSAQLVRLDRAMTSEALDILCTVLDSPAHDTRRSKSEHKMRGRLGVSSGVGYKGPAIIEACDDALNGSLACFIADHTCSDVWMVRCGEAASLCRETYVTAAFLELSPESLSRPVRWHYVTGTQLPHMGVPMV